MSSRYIIYGLTDPRTDEIRYIGRSSSGLARPRRHYWEVAFDDYRARWIRQLRAVNLRYGIIVLEACCGVDALDEAEIRWIAHGRAVGWKLTNTLPGGSAGRSGVACTPETRAKMSAASKGKPKSKAHRAAMSAARKGWILSDEWRAKISAGLRARVAKDPAMRLRLATLRLGMTNSPATREKLRIANTGLIHSAERRAANARGQTGRKRSEESRRKQSESMRRVWAERRVLRAAKTMIRNDDAPECV